MKNWKLGTAACALALSAAMTVSAEAQVLMAHDKDFWRDGMDVMAEAGNFEHTGYVTEQYRAFLQSSMSANNPPDIFTWWTGNALADIVASGQVADVGELWDERIAAGEFSEGTRDLFSVDGVTYGIPMLLARWVVFYNMEMFEEHGLSEPTTWDELEQAAETLHAAGITPFHATVQDGWRGFIWFSEIMIRQNVEAYHGLHDGSVPYDGPEVQAVFDQWLEWYEAGYFSDPRSNEEVEEFARGEAAMYLMGEWATGTLLENGMTIGEDLGVFIMPNANPSQAPGVIVEGAPILISQEAWENPEARRVYEFWASTDGANVWAEAQSLYTGNLSATAPNAIIQEISSDIEAGGHTAITRWWEAVPSDLQGDIVAELSSFMLDPTPETAAEAMANMQAFNADYWADQ
ncbi:ABC transporter substrate-binding protein [Rhodophyticola porphyridii]|uniref:Extracellular solute-binding protein n=1 Tax=Rhodophyticola porphyridii TaxID=1852017 RepID=A0A3L9Y841_9RHOB|nr:extracellular solute-binding protein [Rhodophyticola porphyridii]RMA43665.1 extracellular solute-binding protein [Rhodophyticola porphyridii]